MCVTHGIPCVNMHGTLRAINRRAQIQFVQAANSVRGGSRKEEEEEGRKEKRKGGKKRRKERRKEKKKGEEERKKKEEVEEVLRSEQTRTAKNPKLRYKR